MKKNEITVFNYESNKVRTIERDGEPWFVLKDVCEVLELANPTVVAQRLDEEERAKLNLGRQGDALIINESGLYSVILRSDKAQAKQFNKMGNRRGFVEYSQDRGIWSYARANKNKRRRVKSA